MISNNRVLARVRVCSKTDFAKKLMKPFIFTFCANVRVMVSNSIAARFGVKIAYLH